MISSDLLNWAVASMDRWQEQRPLLDEHIEPFFSTNELVIVRAFVHALFYDGDIQPERLRLDWMEAELQDMFGSYTGLMRAVAHALPWLIQLSPLLLGRHRRTFTVLKLRERIELMEELERGQNMLLGGAFMLFKLMCTTIYLEHPEVMRELHITDRYTYDLELDRHPIYTANQAPLKPQDEP